MADDNSSVFTLGRDFSVLSWMEEDQNDGNGDGGYLGPNHGGQNYDTLYACVCAVDKIAAEMTYDQYSHAQTMITI